METNKNNLKVGDIISIEEAWEDEAGHYHDANAEIIAIHKDGELELDFKEELGNSKDVREFLAGTDGYMANDYKNE